MKTFSIKTLGCKVNQYESQLIREQFARSGFNEVNGGEAADIYIINTCTVTAQADNESRRLVRYARRLNPDATIAVTGCFVEKDADAIHDTEGAVNIVKNADKDRLLSIIEGGALGFARGRRLTDSERDEAKLPRKERHRPPQAISGRISGFEGRAKAFVKVQDGCKNFCSFCKIPYVRGLPRSRRLEDIKKEVAALLDKGFGEIVLTGICLGEWGRDLGKGFRLNDLIEALLVFDKKFRIRLSSIELRYITDKLLTQIARSKKLCKHLHIPLQSGDNSILKMMNRPYTSREYLEAVKKIKAVIPGIGITTDVMVGFPGETDEHFKATLRLLKDCEVHRTHVFSYSRREGTKAAAIQSGFRIQPSVVKERANRVKETASELSYEYRMRFLGKEAEMLVEDNRDKKTRFLTGYSDNYIRILLDGNDSLKGNLVKCRVSEVNRECTIARVK